MADRDLLAHAQKQHSLQSPRCLGVMEPPAPVRPFSTCPVCGFEDYTEWPVVQDRTAELEQAHARIAELERDVKRWQGLTQRWRQLARDRRDDLLIANVELEQAAPWRCMATTTMANFIIDDHRAVWCTLPNGHAGMHCGQLLAEVPLGIAGLMKTIPHQVNWLDEPSGQPEVDRG
ncbi:hypothetical protein ACFWWS_36710 [Streptomyces sp. NPDC059083]|uniref:hypothetical protein n=1 Tax=Streptomyces sp. NPDC059083 TaxID=3346721 RepID=UPI003691F806